MEELLETLDTLLSSADTEWVEQNGETITQIRENITTHNDSFTSMQNDNISLMETNENLTNEIKEHKVKYYKKFMSSGSENNPDGKDEEETPETLSELLNKIK